MPRNLASRILELQEIASRRTRAMEGSRCWLGRAMNG